MEPIRWGPFAKKTEASLQRDTDRKETNYVSTDHTGCFYLHCVGMGYCLLEISALEMSFVEYNNQHVMAEISEKKRLKTKISVQKGVSQTIVTSFPCDFLSFS